MPPKNCKASSLRHPNQQKPQPWKNWLRCWPTAETILWLKRNWAITTLISCNGLRDMGNWKAPFTANVVLLMCTFFTWDFLQHAKPKLLLVNLHSQVWYIRIFEEKWGKTLISRSHICTRSPNYQRKKSIKDVLSWIIMQVFFDFPPKLEIAPFISIVSVKKIQKNKHLYLIPISDWKRMLQFMKTWKYIPKNRKKEFCFFSTKQAPTVAVYPRRLRAWRKKSTSPDCLKHSRNCIETLDFSISIDIIMLHSYFNALHVVDTHQIRITPQ